MAMGAIELARDTWVDRLNAFTRAHEGWLVSLELRGGSAADQPVVKNLPLIGVSAERVSHDGTVYLSVAQTATEHLTQIVHDVVRIYVDPSEDGGTATLVIESVDGSTITARLRATALSDRPMVDR